MRQHRCEDGRHRTLERGRSGPRRTRRAARAGTGRPHALPGGDRSQRQAGGHRRRAPGAGRGPGQQPARGSAGARRPAAAGAARSLSGGCDRRAGRRLAGTPARGLQRRARCARGRGRGPAAKVARAGEGSHGPRVFVRGARPRGPWRQLHRHVEPYPGAEARGTEIPGLGRPARVPSQGAPAGALPVHGRRVPVPARGGGPDQDVRRGGRAGAHQPPLPLPGCRSRRGKTFHRVRLDHALRRGPRRASGHLRSHRQLGCVDRHARRHEEALLGLRPLRAHHVGVDDDQWPGADDPRDVHEHRGGPASGTAPARVGPLGRRGAAHRGDLPRPRAARVPGRPASGT